VVNPMTLLATVPALVASSPRIAGELAYGAGRAAGTGRRLINAVTQSPFGEGVAATGEALADLYNKYPTLALAGAQVGTRLQETEAEQARRMAESYRLPVAPTGEDVAFAPDAVTPEIMKIAAEAPPVAAPGMGGFEPTYTDVDELGRRIDPLTGLPIEEEEVVGMQRGGAVRGYNRGGTALRDRARSVAKGAMFASNDEIEGGIRALGSALSEGDLSSLRQKYLQERDMIRAQQKAYEDAHPIENLLYEGGGAMLTSLVPGMQGATAARMAQIAARSPKAARAAAVAADAALYGAGAAESVRDIPRSIRDEAVLAVPMYGGVEGVSAGINRYRVRKGKKR
jgi:hypothetical protein